MEYVTIELKNASAEQLEQYATILGAEIPEKPTKGNLLALIDAIRPGDAPIRIPAVSHFHVPASADAAIPPSCLAVVQENGRERTYVGLRIPVTKDPGGKDAVPVAVNGIRFDIPRNHDVWVPMEFYQALDNARRWDYDITETGLRAPVEVHDYPFNFVTPKHRPEDQRSLAVELASKVA